MHLQLRTTYSSLKSSNHSRQRRGGAGSGDIIIPPRTGGETVKMPRGCGDIIRTPRRGGDTIRKLRKSRVDVTRGQGDCSRAEDFLGCPHHIFCGSP